MKITIQDIRQNEKTLRELQMRVRDTATQRGGARVARCAWEAACREFHARFDVLFFPEGELGWQDFLHERGDGIELALLFLEADQVTFRSGYHKQIVWNRLKRMGLTQKQQARLEEVAIGYLQKRIRREFWHMANFMRIHGSNLFWEKVRSHMEMNDAATSRKARWLFLTKDGFPVRRWIQREVFRQHYEPGYVANLDVGPSLLPN
jgi:hypothetical protein